MNRAVAPKRAMWIASRWRTSALTCAVGGAVLACAAAPRNVACAAELPPPRPSSTAAPARETVAFEPVALEPIAPRPTSAWAITGGVVAPWAQAPAPNEGGSADAPGGAPARPPAGAALRDATIVFEDARVVGPWPLGCGHARYELVVSPAEGLFQGALRQPADEAARALGVTHLPVMTLAVTCDTGVFDYHLVAPDTALLGLDGVVWTVKREESVSAPSPEAVVHELLALHMTHDMAFTPATLSGKRRFLTSSLAGAIDAYFARPKPDGEPPPINGDPFTDSQEYPSRFTPHAATIGAAGATVPIVFGDGVRTRRVELLLRHEAGTWLVDDLRYERGETLRDLLK